MSKKNGLRRRRPLCIVAFGLWPNRVEPQARRYTVIISPARCRRRGRTAVSVAAGTVYDEPHIRVVAEEIRLGFLKPEHEVVQAAVQDAVGTVKGYVLRQK